MNDLIINGIDHSVFDLEWVKKGGVAYGVTQAGTYTLWTYFQGRFAFLAFRYQHCDWAKAEPQMCLGSLFNDTYVKIADRMATPEECEAAGVEYIDPPIRWLQIDSAPEDGR